MSTTRMASLSRLDDLVRLVAGRHDLYVRWSRGPDPDLRSTSSSDDLTGVRLPGLSASPLGVEDWWGERPARLWIARRLYDYCHLPRLKDPGTRPWVLCGREVGRGPDNEPLVADVEPLVWIGDDVITEAVHLVEQQPGRWGTLDRHGAREQRQR
ncbi:DUF6098 family protein [Streptomyces roseolus]|uniref:DUF6098 family protein n=1 Tax=Streptomyces roseolus TaxID=67358 RepID=UPI00167B43CD|nr:DUF6098 family protein [Streptomyces roseolus]GGR63824.1 hypothetical protein GCM10010282_66100 [Streptomyces roseolus]